MTDPIDPTVADPPRPTATGAADMPLLTVDRVSRRYGGVQALDSVDMAVAEGTIHGLIGPNGAGKSTLLAVIGGQTAVSAGQVRLSGRVTTGLPAQRVAALGIGRTFQSATPLRGATALENVLAGLHLERARRRWGRAAARGQAEALLERFGLTDVAGRDAGLLSFGHTRLLEIARAVAARPRLLLLDEPAAGLAGADVVRLAQVLRELRADGITAVVVDHDVGFIVGLCQRITVLNFGQVIGDGTPEEVQSSSRVRAAYLGGEEASDA